MKSTNFEKKKRILYFISFLSCNYLNHFGCVYLCFSSIICKNQPTKKKKNNFSYFIKR